MAILTGTPSAVVRCEDQNPGSSLVRYIEFDWSKVALDALYIGPAANTNEQALRDCLKRSLPKEAAKNVKIHRSKIPYKPA
jgi:hypothetical protein